MKINGTVTVTRKVLRSNAKILHYDNFAINFILLDNKTSLEISLKNARKRKGYHLLRLLEFVS